MFSRFFIERPIFATVVSIVIVIVGLVALTGLPVAQYPEITPPTVEVKATYPGANAEVLAETVAAPIEQEVNGVENMLYMSSYSASNGVYTLTVTFEVGTDLDIAQVLVQNRVSIANPKLPEDVRRQGVTVKKKVPAILMIVTLTSPDDTYDSLFIHNYALLRLKDEIARLKGVGDTTIFGAEDYSMRVWLDPEKLKARELTTQDVVDAISEQNIQVAAGQIGAPPTPQGQNFQYVINTLGRLNEIQEFEDIIIKTAQGTRVTRVRDVATVERGAKAYDQYFEINGKPGGGIAIYQQPGANALEVAELVRDAMARLSRDFPPGLEYDVPYDTTRFVDASIEQVYHTLFEAVILVFIVIFVFLQDWRATLIPAATIPVSLIGTFAFMSGLGISINMVSLFGLVLAIGIVVDDAIIVVENSWRHMEGGLTAKEATIKAMGEVTGPIVATTLVLLAVFVPTAFLPGITGQLYQQFAITIATAVVISSINALTMAPALCALLLRAPKPPEQQNVFFRAFNKVYGGSEKGYTGLIGAMVRRTALMMLIYLAIVGATGWGFSRLPSGFLPVEDQGYLIAAIQLPDAASQERTQEVVEQVNGIVAETPGVADWVAIGGYSVLDATVASNAATFFIVFDPWDARDESELSQEAILAQLRARFAEIRQGVVVAIVPPPIQGLGVAGGFDLRLQDRSGVGLGPLQTLVDAMVQDANAQSGLRAVYSIFRADTPQLFADVDRTKAKSLDVPLSSVFGTLQAYLGSAYVNDFNVFGRTFQVRVQADPGFRVQREDIGRLEVRNQNGDMVPLGTLVDVRETLGPQVVARYNLYPAASINGEPAPGFSSGQALSLMEQMAEQLPPGFGFEWTSVSYQEKQVGNEALVIFALAILLVFLVLAAQYESWTNPASVILVVPVAFLGTAVAVTARGMDSNVYTQIGIVLLIALASKNAIMIVEFARELRRGGKGLLESAIEASRLRLRPILMTSFAFIFGVLPLVTSSGAGAASQQAVGTAVFGGMITSTFLAVLLVPVFYVVFQRFSEWRKARKGGAAAAPAQPSQAD